jgi:serine protease Do
VKLARRWALAHSALLLAGACAAGGASAAQQPLLAAASGKACKAAADGSAPDFATLAARARASVVSLQTQSSMLGEASSPQEQPANAQRSGVAFSPQGGLDALAPSAALAVAAGAPGEGSEEAAAGLPKSPADLPAAIRRIGAPARAGGLRVSIGSGFLVNSDGLILTNAHVVKGAQILRVTLSDGRQLPGRVLGSNAKLDIAVAKIDASGLQPMPVGNPDAVSVGDWALAIGAPYGFESTVTSGIVSAKKRDLPGNSTPFLQTDVPVNPGNSGGPLINLCGEAIGVNSQIYSRSGGFQGISFAIPIDWALKAAEAIERGEPFGYSRIGVGLQELSPQLAAAFGRPGAKGSIITKIAPNTPAQAHGLREGDVVLAVNGQPLDGSFDFLRRTSSTPPDGSLSLQILRDGKTFDVSMPVVQPPADKPAARQAAWPGTEATRGLLARSLSDAEAQKTGAQSGLLVNQVSGAASEAGLMAGDAILKVGDEPVGTLADFNRDLSGYGERPAPLLVWRNGSRFYAPLGPRSTPQPLPVAPEAKTAPIEQPAPDSP